MHYTIILPIKKDYSVKYSPSIDKRRGDILILRLFTGLAKYRLSVFPVKTSRLISPQAGNESFFKVLLTKLTASDLLMRSSLFKENAMQFLSAVCIFIFVSLFLLAEIIIFFLQVRLNAKYMEKQ